MSWNVEITVVDVDIACVSLDVAFHLHLLWQVKLLAHVFAQEFLGKVGVLDVGVHFDVGLEFCRVGNVLYIAAHACLGMVWNLYIAILDTHVAGVASEFSLHLNRFFARYSLKALA